MPHLEGTFAPPSVIFTLRNNLKSVSVIEALLGLHCQAQCTIFDSPEDVEHYFRTSGISPSAALVLFDRRMGRRHFHPTCRSRSHEEKAPGWSAGAQWMVVVGEGCDQNRCARQISADFFRNFSDRLSHGKFPWGIGKMVDRANHLHEDPPRPISIPETITQTITNLNAGPDLAAAIADTSFAAELPQGSKISWVRVAPEPLSFKSEMITKVLNALRSFEGACNNLAKTDPEVQDLLLAGVDLPKESMLSKAYLFPKVDCFSVGRPDLHYTGENEFPFASEIDEMPGGMPELVHIDNVYGINEKRWQEAFNWLCQDGSLLFLVSHEWSKCYIPETEWLVGHLKRLGYPVEILTTDRVEEIEFRNSGLFFQDKKIGTIWRQFPIFETKGMLEKIVMVAYNGLVRLIPEFAHFGNKAWFSVFRSYEKFYRNELSSEAFEILDKVLPYSYIVDGINNPFPIIVNGVNIDSLEELKNLPQASRDSLVLKICGANNLAARSYGVLMGIGIEHTDWESWINLRISFKQPFVIQRRLNAGTARIPVMNTKTSHPELFSCRILARPWSFNKQLVSVHGCAVPSYLYRVHGMVDMAVVPFAI